MDPILILQFVNASIDAIINLKFDDIQEKIINQQVSFFKISYNKNYRQSLWKIQSNLKVRKIVKENNRIKAKINKKLQKKLMKSK
jgi:hypothetical protein